MHKEELLGERNHFCISALRHKSMQLYSDENILVKTMLFKINLPQIFHKWNPAVPIWEMKGGRYYAIRV